MYNGTAFVDLNKVEMDLKPLFFIPGFYFFSPHVKQGLQRLGGVETN